MRRRLYFLLNDFATTREVVNQLLMSRIDDNHIHVLSNDKVPSDLPEATLLQSTDIVHGIESGMVAGGLIGLLGGIAAAVALSLGTMVGAVILACVLMGSLFGIWISSMIGSDVRNSRLRGFETALEHGKVLLMVDVPSQRVTEITRLIETRASVQREGEEPTIPAFP